MDDLNLLLDATAEAGRSGRDPSEEALESVSASTRDRKATRRRPVRIPMDEAARAQLYRQYRGGTSVEALAEQVGGTLAEVDRAINEVRARRLLETKLEFMPHPSFDDPAQYAEILRPPPGPAEVPAPRRGDIPDDLPPYLASLYEVPLLSREQEMHLFRQMNFLKSRASRLRDRLDPARARTADLDEIERLQEAALAVKNQIIRANLRLVASIAKRYIGPDNTFFELVSDGNMSLIQAIEKFDFARGNKFSTYASWAIIRNFGRSIPGERHRRDRFVTGLEATFEAATDDRTEEREYESIQDQNRQVIRKMFDHLDDRERRILISRYGIDGAPEQTLEQLGRELGITKERVRQIESRAQDKLRKVAAEEEPGDTESRSASRGRHATARRMNRTG